MPMTHTGIGQHTIGFLCTIVSNKINKELNTSVTTADTLNFMYSEA